MASAPHAKTSPASSIVEFASIPAWNRRCWRRSPRSTSPISSRKMKKRLLENISEDDYANPPEGSYFHHVIQKKERLEKLYSQFIESGADSNREKEVFRMLVGELLGHHAPIEHKPA